MSAEPAEFTGATGSAFFTYPSFDSIAKGVANMERLAPEVCKDHLWVACEKIHGSNFSVTFGEGESEPKYASRSGYLEKSFFNHVKVMAPHIPKITKMVEQIRAEKPNVRVQIFGEIYGGAVQTVNVVFYNPEPAFSAFDVFVGGNPMHRDEMFAQLEQFGVPYVKPRARGKLADLLAMDPAFESEIYLTHGLPKPDFSNKAEGMVLQPVVPVTVMDDGTPVRICLKHKNQTHMEVTLKQVKPAKVAASKDAPSLESLPADQQALINKAICYVTLNRLGNLFSKQGPYEADSRQKTLSAFVQDAFVDLGKDVTPEEKALLTKQQKVVRVFMMAQAVQILDAYIASQAK